MASKTTGIEFTDGVSTRKNLSPVPSRVLFFLRHKNQGNSKDVIPNQGKRPIVETVFYGRKNYRLCCDRGLASIGWKRG
jgi:hypothetical protein